MEWQLLDTNLELSPDARVRTIEVLTHLHRQLFDLCATPTGDADKPITEKLSDYLSNNSSEPHLVPEYLVSLLQQETIDGITKFEWLIEMEQQAKELILAALTENEQERFLFLAPDSLLDIEMEDNPLSLYLRSTVSSTPPEGFVCRSPYEYAHVQANGDVYPCCPSKFGKIIGNLTTQNIKEIWDSENARLVRTSIEEGDYRFCNADACEYLRRARAEQNPLSPAPLVQWLKNKGMLEAGLTPKIINLGSDKTCNLACGYCRKELFKLTPAERDRISLIDHHTFEALSDDTERIVLLGEGDPFASPIYLQKLRTYEWKKHKKLKLKIQTNGLLLTPAMWESIANSHPVIDWIAVSIDAATPETYKINRGGDFDKLLRNLEFMAELRASHQIKKFWINFLVQKNNYREIPEFASLGRRLKCDLIEFQRIENWGIYDDPEYRQLAIHESYHEDHKDLLRVLQHPSLKSEGIWLMKLSETLNETAEMGIISWND